MKKKRLLYACISLLFLWATLWLLGRLTLPKYTRGILEGGLIDDYYEETASHQVLFIGDCEVYESFTPPTLFRDFGYSSFIRGSAQQLIWQSRYLLEESLRLEQETPKAVVLSVCSMRYASPQSESYNRMSLDGMKPSLEKWRAVKASLTAEESAFSYLLPLLRYHDRLTQLEKEDIQYLFTPYLQSHNGYLMRCDVQPYTRLPKPPPLEERDFSPLCYAHLDAIVELCKQRDIPLILVKSPCLYPAWYAPWDEALSAYADRQGVVYVNAIEHMEQMGVDLNTDTYDGGMHLNCSGAEKYTYWFAKNYLAPLGLEDERADTRKAALYEEKWQTYEQEKRAQAQEIEQYGYLKSREVTP